MPTLARAPAPRPVTTIPPIAPAATKASSTPTRSALPAYIAQAPSAVSLDGNSGKRLYRTSDGKMVELPPDMTMEEAARLEAEARAAEKKLGKGPPPKPVPDVKKLVKKETKKGKPELGTKGRKEARAKGKFARKPAAAPTALKVASTGKVALYLAAKAAPVLSKGIGTLQRLRQNEQTHEEAPQKLTQAEKAVVIPPSEGQSKSNAGQVNTVSGRTAPTVDENKPKQKLEESLRENIPQHVEDVDNFKRDKKAQHMGADVTKVVLSDKNAVTSTFADMEQTPAPAPPEQTPEALPPEEAVPPTTAMNLGQGAIAPLQKEHTDLSNYTKEADAKLKEEDITQEQLDMADSGDLAVANQEKKGMQATAKTEPLAVQTFAAQESTKVDKELKQAEKTGRDGLRAKRKAALGATAQKQKGTRSSLEKKREEVASKINGIYKTAQDKVKKKLADLETQSLKRFDEGNAKATKEFEDTVNRELDAFKKDRYSGAFGWAKKAKDWWLGMDELPGVKAIFERNRAIFVAAVNKLVDNISADNKRVIQECKDELTRAKKEIKDYVDKLGPDLKGIGEKAAGEMNTKLNELDQFVAKKEQDLQDQLKDKQQAAIKAIDEKIEKMKESMSGALSKFGKLMLQAAKKFFTWALKKFGYSLSDIESIINKGVAVLKAIFGKPIQFVKNLMKAASTGFTNFGKNFLKHLKDAVFEWLTGSLQGLVLPQSWDLKGILSVIFQLVGLTYQNIRAHLVKLVPEPVVKTMETGFELVKTLITQGPMAAWEQLKEIGNDMKDAFVEAVKDWIKWKLVQKAIETVLSMLIPGAGIIRAIIGIYDTIVFFIQKAKDIAKMVGNFLGSIGAIAAGNIGAAAEALEMGLARALKLVIDFLARFLRLSGITKKIQETIQKIRGKVDDVLARVAKWVVGKAQKAGKFMVSAAQSAADLLFEWWKNKISFSDKKGKSHRLFFSGQGTGARLKVATAEMFTEEFVAKIEKVFTEVPLTKAFGLSYLGECKRTKQEIDKLKAQLEREKKLKSLSARDTDRRLKNAMQSLSVAMRPLFDILPENQTYDLPVTVGDPVTLPYKGTERKAEILFASTERVHFNIEWCRATLQLPTVEFKKKWTTGEIRPYIEEGAREKYLGDTPGKASTTGKAVIAKYKTDVNEKGEVIVEWRHGDWWPLMDCDMSHDPVDAVTYWNDTARPKGYVPKGPEVRAWMLDPKNYILEPAHINRRRGSRRKEKYLPP